MKSDILIVGVGGQGIILASEILSRAALGQGLNIKKAETHGMAQRGGSVVTHVRLSDSVIYSPLIPWGTADVMIAFEPLEALRYLKYINENTALIVNSNPVKIADYPDVGEILAEIEKYGNPVILDALKLAEEAGNTLTQNTVILGAASRYIPVKKEIIKETIRETVKKAVDENLKAFELGAQ